MYGALDMVFDIHSHLIPSSSLINKESKAQRGQDISLRSKSPEQHWMTPCFCHCTMKHLYRRNPGSQEIQILTHLTLLVYPQGFYYLRTCKDLPFLFTQSWVHTASLTFQSGLLSGSSRVLASSDKGRKMSYNSFWESNGCFLVNTLENQSSVN